MPDLFGSDMLEVKEEKKEDKPIQGTQSLPPAPCTINADSDDHINSGKLGDHVAPTDTEGGIDPDITKMQNKPLETTRNLSQEETEHEPNSCQDAMPTQSVTNDASTRDIDDYYDRHYTDGICSLNQNQEKADKKQSPSASNHNVCITNECIKDGKETKKSNTSDCDTNELKQIENEEQSNEILTAVVLHNTDDKSVDESKGNGKKVAIEDSEDNGMHGDVGTDKVKKAAKGTGKVKTEHEPNSCQDAMPTQSVTNDASTRDIDDYYDRHYTDGICSLNQNQEKADKKQSPSASNHNVCITNECIKDGKEKKKSNTSDCDTNELKQIENKEQSNEILTAVVLHNTDDKSVDESKGNGKKVAIEDSEDNGTHGDVGTDKVKKAAKGTGKVKKVAKGTGKVKKAAKGTDKVKKAAKGTGNVKKVAKGTGKVKKAAKGTGKVKKGAKGTGKVKKVAKGTGKVKKAAKGTGKMKKAAKGTGKVKKVAKGTGNGKKVTNDIKKGIVSNGNAGISKKLVVLFQILLGLCLLVYVQAPVVKEVAKGEQPLFLVVIVCTTDRQDIVNVEGKDDYVKGKDKWIGGCTFQDSSSELGKAEYKDFYNILNQPFRCCKFSVSKQSRTRMTYNISSLTSTLNTAEISIYGKAPVFMSPSSFNTLGVSDDMMASVSMSTSNLVVILEGRESHGPGNENNGSVVGWVVGPPIGIVATVIVFIFIKRVTKWYKTRKNYNPSANGGDVEDEQTENTGPDEHSDESLLNGPNANGID
ncbi:uncharacterized protein LOC128246945 [Mya arenaria]|uniref:uncharacterized protein LOC128246945 n=1 Tax=Mya arenaria TaxID=6604 RepID=UPI0022E49FF1|nr:uncharacterized protein LOC128246945 [Mya arenaria]